MLYISLQQFEGILVRQPGKLVWHHFHPLWKAEKQKNSEKGHREEQLELFTSFFSLSLSKKQFFFSLCSGAWMDESLMGDEEKRRTLVWFGQFLVLCYVGYQSQFVFNLSLVLVVLGAVVVSLLWWVRQREGNNDGKMEWNGMPHDDVLCCVVLQCRVSFFPMTAYPMTMSMQCGMMSHEIMTPRRYETKREITRVC